VFGFLRRRLIREQIVSIHQNMSAAEGCLAGYFHNDPEVLSLLSSAAMKTREIGESAPVGARISSNAMAELLDINMQLRRLYDATTVRHVESFDEATTPMMGWDWTIKRALDRD